MLNTRRVLEKIALGAALALVLIVGGAFTAIELRWTRTFDAPYPDIHASADPAIVAQGKYLVYRSRGMRVLPRAQE